MPEVIIDIPQYVNMTYEPLTWMHNTEVTVHEVVKIESEKGFSFASDGMVYQIETSGNQTPPSCYTSYVMSTSRRRIKR